MRHAQAESVAPSDSERALTPRGRHDAEAAGRWLAQFGFTPDHAVVSGAIRTRETWQAMASAAGWEIAPDVEPALYHAGAEAALDLVRLAPEDAREVLVLGHNPTISHVANLLQDGAGAPGAGLAMAQGHPTAALAVFDVTEAWSRLAWGDGRLTDFVVARA